MSIFEYDKEEEERKLRKAEYEAAVADGFNDGINTAKKDTVRLHIAKSSWFDRRLLSGTILTSIFPDKRCRDQFSFPLNTARTSTYTLAVITKHLLSPIHENMLVDESCVP